MLKKAAIILSLLIISLSCLVIWKFERYLSTPTSPGSGETTILIRQGQTFNEVVDLLYEKGIIREKLFFTIWSRIRGYDKTVEAGEYRLSPAMTPAQVLQTLTLGNVTIHYFTVPEGYNIYQIATLLDKKGIVKRDVFLKMVHDPSILKHYGISAPSLEGFLYPDTYGFSYGTSPKTIVDIMVKHFFEKVKPYRDIIKKRGMTLEQVVTLASIVEKETGKGDERPLIASVFLNRLKRGMRLQSDPTVIYGIKNFNGNLTRKDLRKFTPYNTYVIKGLPPGPISNPHIDSIKAVLFPASTEYLYFVSKNNGTHYFSKTLAEHQRAVYSYQKRHRTGSKKKEK